MHNYIIILFVILLTTVSCFQRTKQNNTVAKVFSVPEVPAILTTPEQKAEFVASHYWDNFAFTDTTLIGNADITEQAFADFMNLLPHLSPQLIEKGISAMMNKATADSAMYVHFIELSEKYLYDPNSPFRNEDIYIMVIQNIIDNKKLDDIYKVRPQYQLALAQKNRVGNKATDFTYTSEKGDKTMLYSVVGNPLLLFFFRPDCPDCQRVKSYVADKELANQVKILFINPDKDNHLDTIYDLRASPTLYLLDRDKKILLKDAPIEQIEQYLINNKAL